MDGFSLLLVIMSVTLLGVSKAGFGGGGTALALPLMALGMPTELALGVVLPLLLATDVISVAAHRKSMDLRAIRFAVPGAVIGVVIGVLIIDLASPRGIAGTIGALSILFAIYGLSGRQPDVSGWPRWIGSVFGVVSGLTSTIAHAGGPPIQVYFLTQGYAPKVFVATSAGFMAVVNLLKLGPFLFIGTLDQEAMGWALTLAPIAILSAFAGVVLARVISKTAFNLTINLLLIATGVKLLFDALSQAPV